ncbi:TPA: MFS transporter [Staphylococcus aureus]
MTLRNNNNFKSILTMGLFTNIGDSLFFIVTMWYISFSYDSPVYAGLAVFLFTVPEALLIFLGPMIDRVNPKKILKISVIIQLSVHLILILLFFTDTINIYLLLILLLLSAIASTITYPVEETILPQIVDNDEIVKANSLFTVAYKLTDAFFDGLGGIVLAIGSALIIYEMNLLIFLIPLIMLKFFKFNVQTEDSESFSFSSYKLELKEGIYFVLKTNIKYILLPIVVINLFTAISTVGLPFYAKELNSNPSTYGFLLAFGGVGSILGVIFINRITKFIGAGKILSFGLLLHGLMWILFTFSLNTFMAYFFIFMSYFFMGAYNIVYSSLFQVITPNHMLGRVNTTIDSLITVAMPIGGLIGGIIINMISVNLALSLQGIALIITAFIYIFNKWIFNIDKISAIESNI